MIITCPGCGASFNVNPDALGAAGRKVRCSKCSHQWLALPDGTSTELDSPVDAHPAPAPATPENPPPPDIPVPENPPSAFVAEPDQPVPPLPELPESNPDVTPAEPAFAADPQPEPLFSTDPEPVLPAEPVAAPDPTPEPASPTGGRNIAAEFGATDAPPEMLPDPFPEMVQEPAAEAHQTAPLATTESDAIAQALADPPPIGMESPAPPVLDAETQATGPSAAAAMDGFPPPPIAPPETPNNRNRANPPRRRSGRAATFALIGLILFLGGLGAGAFRWQKDIVMWLPWSNSVYAMIGLQPDILGTGLQIIEPKPKKKIKGNDEILVVEGEIRNTSNHPLSLPLMRGALLGKDGSELHVWTFRADQAQIEPGELVGYKTEFRNPPGTAQKLDITFTRPGEMGIANKIPSSAKPVKEPTIPRLK